MLALINDRERSQFESCGQAEEKISNGPSGKQIREADGANRSRYVVDLRLCFQELESELQKMPALVQ